VPLASGRKTVGDNPASLAVSRKAGYADNGWEPGNRMGKRATMRRIILEPAKLVRFEHKLTVEGLPEFRRSIGLDDGQEEDRISV